MSWMAHFSRLGHKCACVSYFSSYNSYTPSLVFWVLSSSVLSRPWTPVKGNSSALAFQRRCGTGRLNQYIRSTAAVAVGDLFCLSTIAAMSLLAQTHLCILARVWTSRPLCRSLVQVLPMSATCQLQSQLPCQISLPCVEPQYYPTLPFPSLLVSVAGRLCYSLLLEELG